MWRRLRRRSFPFGRLAASIFARLAICVFVLPGSPASAGPGRWVGTWSASPQPPLPGPTIRYDDQTIRLIVHTSIGGRRVRVQISNRFGDTLLALGAVHIAIRSSGADVDPSTDRALTFNGRPTATIAPHRAVISDPVTLSIGARSDLAVSIFFSAPAPVSTTHILARQTSYVSTPGDQSRAASFPVAQRIHSWPFLTGVDVEGEAAAAIVLFGDSLVDGDGSTSDRNARWGDDLSARLQSAHLAVGVLNAGIIGNRLLRGSPGATTPGVGEAFGPAALARVGSDALDLPGVRWMVVRIGTNDIAAPGALSPVTESVDEEDIIAGLTALAAQARRRHVQVIGTTIPPFEGAAIVPRMYSPQKERVRQEVNAWIRTHRLFEAVVDLDEILRDPDHPSRLRPALDSGDHIHPNDAGYALMAAAFRPSWLRRGLMRRGG
jgi:lysophospholipase L1-like esterase